MRRRNVYGLTLIELMIAGALVTLVGAGTFALLSRAWKNQEALLTQNEVQRDARAGCDLVCDAIRGIPYWNCNSAVAYRLGAGRSIVGVTDNSNGIDWDIRVKTTAPRKLIRIEPAGSSVAAGTIVASVSDIQSLDIVYWPLSISGGVVSISSTPVILSNVPWIAERRDSSLPGIVAATVTVTAAKTSMYGVTYTSTVSSTVKIRAQAYTLAPS